MLPWTALIKYHPQVHQHAAETTPVGMIDPHLGIIATTDVPPMIIEIGTGSVIPNPTHTTLDTGVTAAVTPTGVTPDCFIDLHVVALHATEAQVHTATAVTHHIADPHPIKIALKMTAGPDHTKPCKQHYKPAQGSSSSSQTTPWKNKDRRHKQVTTDDPSSEYYSSHEQDSDSKDNLN